MAAEITKATGIKCLTRPGRKSSFEVTMGSTLLHSKLQSKTFPTSETIIAAVKPVEKPASVVTIEHCFT